VSAGPFQGIASLNLPELKLHKPLKPTAKFYPCYSAALLPRVNLWIIAFTVTFMYTQITRDKI
jgi:hypothetical protein